MQEYHAMGTTEDRCFLYFNNENDVGQNNGKSDNEIVLKAGGLLGHLSISQIKNLVSSSFKIGHNNNFFKCSNDIVISNPRTVQAVNDEKNLETLVEEKNVNQIINKFTENSNNCDKKPKNNTWTSNRNKRFFQLTQIKQQLKLNQRLNYEKKMRLLEKKIMKDRTKLKDKNQSENQKNNDKENVNSPRTIVLRTKKGPLNIYYTNNGSRTRSVSLIRPRNVSILESAGSFNVKAGTGKLYELDGIFDGLNKGKINGDAINRIANPTEAFKVKTMNEDLLPSPQSTIRGTMTRDFICEMCKKRHTR